MIKPANTFANLPFCDDLGDMNARIAILGIPYGTSYDPDSEVHCRNAARVIRQESVRYPDDPVAWDFDLGGPLLDDEAGQVVDCGDAPGYLDDSEGNRLAARGAIQGVLAKGAVPLVLGGDDSIPIPVLRAYEAQEPFNLLQVDAHIDWKDEVDGVRDGYSSTMRRASELSWVERIVQVGMRGVGSARTEEYRAARAYGAEFITSYRFREEGVSSVLTHLPQGSRCFLTIDLDGLDPSEMPAVGGTAPGGLQYMELVKLIHAVSDHTQVVGVCLVEFVPEKDLNHLGAIVAMRVAWNVIGALLRKQM